MSLPEPNTVSTAARNNHIILGTKPHKELADFDTFNTPRYMTHNLARTEHMLIRTQSTTDTDAAAQRLVYNYVHSAQESDGSFEVVYISNNPHSHADLAIPVEKAEDVITNLHSEMSSRLKLVQQSQSPDWDHILYGSTPHEDIEHNIYGLPPMRITHLVLVLDNTLDLLEYYGPEKTAQLLEPFFIHGRHTGIHVVQVMANTNTCSPGTQKLIDDLQVTSNRIYHNTGLDIINADEATWVADNVILSPTFNILGL